MGARSKDFTIAFWRMALEIPVRRENGIAIWQVSRSSRWIRFYLLGLAGIRALTLSVWAHAFRQSTQIAINIRTDSNCEINGSGGALEHADV
jgi:hypothetical protein